MGIIPFLMMLRLRNRRAQDAETKKSEDTPEKRDERLLKYMESKATRRARDGAAMMRALPDPMQISRGIFD